MYTLPKIESFNQNVLSKYQIYNSLFLTLPFDEIDNTGVMLPLFSEVCDKGFKKQETPIQIIDFFASKYMDKAKESDIIDLMFRFIQYIERQIVLFDAIEDASFSLVNNLEGRGSLRDIKELADEKEKTSELREFLDNFNVRPVLTAHPTQFYPGTVLGIITDPFGKFVQKVKAPNDGYIINANHSPIVYEGDAIYHISNMLEGSGE
jgi:phosphoenolpyruvate carboxylase